jgi:hypothetical protein
LGPNQRFLQTFVFLHFASVLLYGMCRRQVKNRRDIGPEFFFGLLEKNAPDGCEAGCLTV